MVDNKRFFVYLSKDVDLSRIAGMATSYENRTFDIKIMATPQGKIVEALRAANAKFDFALIGSGFEKGSVKEFKEVTGLLIYPKMGDS